MFFYNPFIAIPAGGSATADMACPVTQDVTVSTAVSHMHQRGVGYTSELYDGDPSQDGQVIRTLHESTEWEEPLTDQFDPPLTFTAGEWVRFACDYDNTATVDVAQGQETTDEMCMFIGAYWPRNAGWEQCGFNGAGRNFGSGTMSGAEFADCWDSSPKAFYGGGSGDAAARYATMRCITESCPAVSARAADYIFRGDQTVRDITCD
jgi:hypothetical protein